MRGVKDQLLGGAQFSTPNGREKTIRFIDGELDTERGAGESRCGDLGRALPRADRGYANPDSRPHALPGKQEYYLLVRIHCFLVLLKLL